MAKPIIDEIDKVSAKHYGFMEEELDSIIRDYAKWYFSEYQPMHITEIEDTEKRRIMNDNNKHSQSAESSCDT